MKKLVLLFIGVLFLSGCVNKGWIRNANELEGMLYMASTDASTEELFCAEFTGLYIEDNEEYWSCFGENGHFQYLKSLGLSFDDKNDVNVEVEAKDNVYIFTITIDGTKIELGSQYGVVDAFIAND